MNAVMDRRQLLRRALAAGLAGAGAHRVAATPGPPTAAAQITPRLLVFPRDHGAHPAHAIEWWYLTALLDPPATGAAPLGLQVTFFRARTAIDPANPSRFAAHQLLIAHAALADPTRGQLQHDQRIARTGVGGVRCAEHDTDVALGRWQLAREPDGAYRCTVDSTGFAVTFTATPTQPLLLQGRDGYSVKGIARGGVTPASHYYSQPHLALTVSLTRDGQSQTMRGRGWLDHEWSSELLSPDAAGWDWVGLNLDDGSAITAFRIRPRRGDASLYAYASVRAAGGRIATLAPTQVHFTPREFWTSPRTGARYPVGMRITLGDRTLETEPLLPDQELDSRATTGAVYWEGASRVRENGQWVGRGYLEMTGYAAPLQLPGA